MLYIKKGKEPEFLLKFKKAYPTKTYGSEEFSQFRMPLNDYLRKEQKGLCAYCCARIKEKESHNEHIEPQHPGSYTSHASLDYFNMVASCNRPRTCGNRKRNTYDKERFVSPLEENCEQMFTYYADGRMEGDPYTIDLLNLNDYELKSARRAVFKALQGLDKRTISCIYMDEGALEYQPFLNVVKWYWNTLQD